MLRYITKIFHFYSLLGQNFNSKDKNIHTVNKHAFSENLDQNLNKIRSILGASNDIIIREFAFGNNPKFEGALIYIDGMTDSSIINESIVKPLMYDSQYIPSMIKQPINIQNIKKSMVAVGNIKEVDFVDDAINSCLSGETVFLINSFKRALVISTSGWETRSLQEPDTEAVVRGPREGFTETIRSNTTLLRRKIRNPNLTFETMVLGTQTKTNVCIAFLKGVVNPKLIEEIRKRLKRIKTDAILESGYIEQFIEDAPFSPFATIANSERPDLVAAKILEGRAAILVDGTPFVLTVPMVFIESFQSPEDYYARPFFSSVIRFLRFLSFFTSILAPAVYVALVTIHQDLLPTPLLITLASARQATPFPAVVEALGMGLIFEILREAGLRLPRPVGQTISIVGALVIGQVAVSAGLVSASVIIMVSLTAITSFVVPAQSDVGVILRIVFLLAASTLGGFGILIGLLFLLIHLSSLRSFGTPYLSPLAPITLEDLKDTFVRAPLWAMLTRPRSIGRTNLSRQKFGLKPSPPSDQQKREK